MSHRSVDRHEALRADWILAHERSWTLSDRRRALAIKRRAATLARDETGASESSFHEGRIPWIGARFIARGEGAKARAERALQLWAIYVPLIAVTFGPILALSTLFYRASETLLPEAGLTPRSWPWLVAGITFGSVGYFLLRPREFATLYLWPHVLYVDWIAAISTLSWAWLTGALLMTALHIRQHGWPAVKASRTLSIPGPAIPSAPTVPVAPGAAVPAVVQQGTSPEPATGGGPTPAVPTPPPAPTAETADEPDLSDDEVADPSSEDDPIFADLMADAVIDLDYPIFEISESEDTPA